MRVWEPPARLVLVWRLNAKWEYDPGLDTEVELRFIADGVATNVELEHRHIERMPRGAPKPRATPSTARTAGPASSRITAIYAEGA